MRFAIIIIGIALILAVGGILWLQQNTPEQSRVSDDWLTYRNEATKYEIQYPADWNIVQEKIKASFSSVSIVSPNQNFVAFYSAIGGTGRDTLALRCIEIVEEGNIDINGIEGTRKVFQTYQGVYDGRDVYEEEPCEDPLGAYLVLVDFSVNSTGNPMVDYTNPEYKEYSFEFYIFDNNLALVNEILSTFRFLDQGSDIQLGTFPIDLDELRILWIEVQNGHQPWRLNALEVAKAEGTKYGFNTEDEFTLLARTEYTAYFGVQHSDNAYTLRLIRRLLGEGNEIWSLVEIKEGISQTVVRTINLTPDASLIFRAIKERFEPGYIVFRKDNEETILKNHLDLSGPGGFAYRAHTTLLPNVFILNSGFSDVLAYLAITEYLDIEKEKIVFSVRNVQQDHLDIESDSSFEIKLFIGDECETQNIAWMQGITVNDILYTFADPVSLTCDGPEEIFKYRPYITFKEIGPNPNFSQFFFSMNSDPAGEEGQAWNKYFVLDLVNANTPTVNEIAGREIPTLLVREEEVEIIGPITPHY